MSDTERPAPKPAAKPKAKPTDDQLRSVDEWHSLLAVESPGPKQRRGPTGAHAAAAILHGWPEHRHHMNAPMQLTREDYLAALKATVTPVQQEQPPPPAEPRGTSRAARVARPRPPRCIPHPAALSPYAPNRDGKE